MTEWHPEEMKKGEYKLGFHKPWCTSVGHLHMHMMVGKRKAKARVQFCSWFYREVKEVAREIEERFKM